MKKFIICLLLCFSVLLTGCSSYGGVGTVKMSDGSIVEFFYIPFNESVLTNLEGDAKLTLEQCQEIKADAKVVLDKIFDNYTEEYIKYIGTLDVDKYSIDKKQELIDGVTYDHNDFIGEVKGETVALQYNLTFANSECYEIFINVNNILKTQSVTDTIVKTFATVKKTTKYVNLNNGGQKTLLQSAVEVLQSVMVDNVGSTKWQSVKTAIKFDELKTKYTYSYAVPTKRLHSNADYVEEFNGYYMHTWEFTGEPKTIEVWTLTANRGVWYLVIAGATVLFVIGLFIFNNFKKKKDLQKAVQENQNQNLNNQSLNEKIDEIKNNFNKDDSQFNNTKEQNDNNQNLSKQNVDTQEDVSVKQNTQPNSDEK